MREFVAAIGPVARDIMLAELAFERPLENLVRALRIDMGGFRCDDRWEEEQVVAVGGEEEEDAGVALGGGAGTAPGKVDERNKDLVSSLWVSSR